MVDSDKIMNNLSHKILKNLFPCCLKIFKTREKKLNNQKCFSKLVTYLNFNKDFNLWQIMGDKFHGGETPSTKNYFFSKYSYFISLLPYICFS